MIEQAKFHFCGYKKVGNVQRPAKWYLAPCIMNADNKAKALCLLTSKANTNSKLKLFAWAFIFFLLMFRKIPSADFIWSLSTLSK